MKFVTKAEFEDVVEGKRRQAGEILETNDAERVKRLKLAGVIGDVIMEKPIEQAIQQQPVEKAVIDTKPQPKSKKAGK